MVADEIRKLAEESAGTTKEIAALIRGIQSSAREAVSAMEGSVTEVESGGATSAHPPRNWCEPLARSLPVYDLAHLRATCTKGMRPMKASKSSVPKIQVCPATSANWSDVEVLFGPKGAYAGCWCMFWRRDRAEFKRDKGEGNRKMLEHLTQTDRVPGLLAYVNGEVAGWCSIGPREHFVALENSRILKRVDDRPVWSISCFFVAKAYRRQGLMQRLIEAAVEYAGAHGAERVEGYPIDLETPQLKGQELGSYAGYMGMASAYRAAGFVEVGRASETQLIMRRECQSKRSRAVKA